MAIHVALHHSTRYSYDRPVSFSPHVVRLRPAPHCRTPILAYSLKIEPANHFINWQQDPQGNYLARIVFPEKDTKLNITVDLVAELAVYNPFDFFLEPSVETLPLAYDPEQASELSPFHERLQSSPLLDDYCSRLAPQGRRSMDLLVELNQRLQKEIS